MPTAAKLFAALGFAALGWLAAAVLGQGLPEGIVIGLVPEGAIVAGLVCGWAIAGREAGRGYGTALGTGLRTGAVMVVVVLLAVAIWAMLEASMRRQYPGPFEALMGMVQLMLKYGRLTGDAPFIGVMAAGSTGLGLLTEVVGRRWS